MDATATVLSTIGVRSRGLTRRFGEHLALSPFDLDARVGEITGLLGPNGSGKSTLLRCLTGLVRADAGSAEVAGVALHGDGTAVRRRCTYSPGEVAVYGELSGAAHIDWLLRGRDPASVARARSIAEDLGLPLERRVHTYSHGMKRQLYFSCALAPDVPVRILDEITEGLDPNVRGRVLDMLQDDARKGRTILLSSHHLGEVDRVCDHLVFLNGGVKIAEESAEGLAARAKSLIQLRFADEREAEVVRARLGEALECLRAEDGVLSLRARSGDATSELAQFLAREGLPRPLSLRAGELSLRELYRDLYGVDAC
ncbi:MAG: ABC transporter ATP-binding protein [Planctomycetes bacterium]|nr:ABC transporter ATP-binding protein [Planctomycetota bacterium]